MALPVLVISGWPAGTCTAVLMGLTILLHAAVFFIAAYKLGAVKRPTCPPVSKRGNMHTITSLPWGPVWTWSPGHLKHLQKQDPAAAPPATAR